MKEPRVFVIQQTLKMERGKLVPKFTNINEAEVFGRIETLLSASTSPFSPTPVIAELTRKLKDYDGATDYLLLIGNPCLIGWAVAIAASVSGGRVNLLQWNGRESRYLPIRAQGLIPVPKTC